MISLVTEVMAGAVSGGTCILYAAIGESFAESAGVVNLGVEGSMLVGALTGYAVTAQTGSPWVGAAAALATGGALAAVHAWFVPGEPGWEVVPEVAPLDGELIIDKPGKGSFYATDVDLLLRIRGLTHLVFTGITTDVCVHTTMRDANDRGYECLLLSDCTGATDKGNYEAALLMVTMQGGVFGAIATSEELLEAIAT